MKESAPSSRFPTPFSHLHVEGTVGRPGGPNGHCCGRNSLSPAPLVSQTALGVTDSDPIPNRALKTKNAQKNINRGSLFRLCGRKGEAEIQESMSPPHRLWHLARRTIPSGWADYLPTECAPILTELLRKFPKTPVSRRRTDSRLSVLDSAYRAIWSDLGVLWAKS